MIRSVLTALALTLVLCATLADGATLVRDGRTRHVIHIDAKAPATVKQAARELRDYVCEVTGADIRIVNKPANPMVCLGANAAARAAGLTTKGAALEGYRIAVKGENIYILGPDTPDGGQTLQGGTSAGTRNGVYTFIERYFGVRWLLPGPHGDYIPKRTTLDVPAVNVVETPGFLNRRLPYTHQRRKETIQWFARQKLGLSLALSHGHNWKVVGPAEYKDHPEWFALRGGKRVPPVGRFKYCTTNPGLRRAFAEKAIAHFDAEPRSTTFSLSPSDSAGWCECTTCKREFEKDPFGKLSVTPAILNFYNGVARIVAKKYPKKVLAGYVYAQYVFPPKRPIKLEPNVFLIWAPSFDYGYTLYRDSVQKLWDDLVPQWTKVTTNIAYYDLPNCVANAAGAPNAPGVEILKFLYPRLKKHKMKGVYVYGMSAWGTAAAGNYLLAKLAWNPEADIDAHFDDFCEKAYEGGAEEMKAFFRLMDSETKRHFREDLKERYGLSAARMKNVYAHNFSEMERLYTAADGKIKDADARARLEMLGLNLTILSWNLRKRGLLPEEKASRFYTTDAQFVKLVRETTGSLALSESRSRVRVRDLKKPLTVTAAKVANASPVNRRARLRGAQHLVIMPDADGRVALRYKPTRTYGDLIWATLLDAKGKQLRREPLTPDTPFAFDGKAGTYYHLHLGGSGRAFFELGVTGARWALDGRADSKGLHLIGKVTPLYFEVPTGVKRFDVWLVATPPGETAAAILTSPTGRRAATYDCSQKSVDAQTLTVKRGETGLWKLVITKAKTGAIDDVWVKPGKNLPGYFSINPKQALSVIAEK